MAELQQDRQTLYGVLDDGTPVTWVEESLFDPLTGTRTVVAGSGVHPRNWADHVSETEHADLTRQAFKRHEQQVVELERARHDRAARREQLLTRLGIDAGDLDVLIGG